MPGILLTGDGDARTSLPEEKLFRSVFRAVLIYKVVSGLGKLALIWATVVLLGGFVTQIKPLDFRIVTAIVFIEAISIFSTAEDPEEEFFIRAPEVMADIQRASSKFNFCSNRFFFASIFPRALMLAQLSAVTTSISLSLWRLIKQDYVNQEKQCDKRSCKDDQENINMSMNIFYVLVVVQGLFFFTNLASPMRKQMYMVCEKYNLDRGPGLQLLARYILDNHMKCVTGNVRCALNNDLVTYAQDLIISDATVDQHLGVWTLDRILRADNYKVYALMKLRTSGHDAIERIVSFLALGHKTESRDPEQEGIKACEAAVHVLLELVPYLTVGSFPCLLQLVSSLLTEGRVFSIYPSMRQECNENFTGESSYWHNVNFSLYSVQILDKLMENADNCWYLAQTGNCLMKNIIDLITNCTHEAIAEASVTVLRKLAGSAGEVGGVLRCSISKNVHILSSITSILEYRASGTPRLQAEAADLLACLALDEYCKQDMSTSRRVIRALATVLVVNAAPPAEAEIHEEGSRSYHSHRARLTKCAAEALVLLTTGRSSQSSNTSSILLEIEPDCIQKFVHIISHEEGEHIYLIAKLLSNLRAYSNADQYAHHLRKIDSTLPEIMKAINLGVEKLMVPGHCPHYYAAHTSKLLESFAGLGVQICTFTQAGHHLFADALKSADLEDGAFVHKLKELLTLHKSPTTEFPGIRRTTVQLIIWMMRNNSNGYTRQFVQCGMDEALREVADTETLLERFELFHCGVGVCKHSEPISSLINVALTGM